MSIIINGDKAIQQREKYSVVGHSDKSSAYFYTDVHWIRLNFTFGLEI